MDKSQHSFKESNPNAQSRSNTSLSLSLSVVIKSNMALQLLEVAQQKLSSF